jgi:hypothetical protein
MSIDWYIPEVLQDECCTPETDAPDASKELFLLDETAMVHIL